MVVVENLKEEKAARGMQSSVRCAYICSSALYTVILYYITSRRASEECIISPGKHLIRAIHVLLLLPRYTYKHRHMY